MGNALKLGAQVTPTQANGGISTGAIAIYPCHHATTENSLTDISGNDNDGLAGVAFVGATNFASTAGVLTADAASTDSAQRLSSFGYSFNNGDSLLIANRIRIATSLPGSSKPVWAQGGSNTAAPGWSLKVSSSGVLFLQLDHATTSNYLANTDKAGPADDGKLTADAWHSLMVALWNHNVSAGTAYYGIWINGKYAYNVTTARTASNMPTSCTPVEAMRIGQYYRTSGQVTISIGATQSSYHFYRAPNAVTHTFSQMDALAKRLYRQPELPLSLAEWPMS